MHIIAIGWIYVVSMMAITEKSVIAGIMTFTFYCVIPLGVVWFIVDRKKRNMQKAKEHTDLKIQQHDSNKPDQKLE
jgi:hypothetical protein